MTADDPTDARALVERLRRAEPHSGLYIAAAAAIERFEREREAMEMQLTGGREGARLAGEEFRARISELERDNAELRALYAAERHSTDVALKQRDTLERERCAIVAELDAAREKHLREARAADEARDDFEGLRARVAELTEQAKQIEEAHANFREWANRQHAEKLAAERERDELARLRPAAEAGAGLEEWLRAHDHRCTVRRSDGRDPQKEIHAALWITEAPRYEMHEGEGPTLSAAIQSALEKARGT